MGEEQPVPHASKASSTSPTTVAFLGPTATYTHQAALTYFGSSTSEKKYALLPSPTISSVFHAVRDSSATYGVVPYENSTNGAVAATLDLLADNESNNEEAVSRDLIIVGEVYVPVHHCLLGRRRPPPPPQQQQEEEQQQQPSSSSTPLPPIPSPPSTPYSHIRTLYSHPQAWGQCTRFLAQHLPHAARHDCTSTSRAAELAAADRTGASAAVANASAAEVNGLEVLARDLVDDPEGNETRFLVLRRRGGRRRGAGEGRRGEQLQQPQQQQQQPFATATTTTTTLLTFVPKRSSPSSRGLVIVSILSLLQQANSGAEITKLHSRPRPASSAVSGMTRKPWEYVHLVELRRQDARLRDDHDDEFEDNEYPGGSSSVSGDLGKLVESVRCLGVWEDRFVPPGSGGGNGGDLL